MYLEINIQQVEFNFIYAKGYKNRQFASSIFQLIWILSNKQSVKCESIVNLTPSSTCIPGWQEKNARSVSTLLRILTEARSAGKFGWIKSWKVSFVTSLPSREK